MKAFATSAAFVLLLTKAYAADTDMAGMSMPMTPPGTGMPLARARISPASWQASSSKKPRIMVGFQV